jgi:hypothetical protein
VNDGVQ